MKDLVKSGPISRGSLYSMLQGLLFKLPVGDHDA